MSSGIIRVKKDTRYFTASNEPFNDSRLRWGARGVMGYLLSKPDGWECRNADLEAAGPGGQHQIRSIIKELKKFGYIHRHRQRGKTAVSNGSLKFMSHQELILISP